MVLLELMSEAKKRVGGKLITCFLGNDLGSSLFYLSTQLFIIYIQHTSAVKSRGGGVSNNTIPTPLSKLRYHSPLALPCSDITD